jgi:hypothetical protein
VSLLLIRIYIFWAHHVFVKLFNTFPSVLIMNYTFKASVYRKPLSEIVGVYSKEKTYYASYTFLTSEKEENFTWVLQMMLDLVKSADNMSKVIVADMDTKLMNFVTIVFIKTTALFCHFHIVKNVISSIFC